MSEAVDAIPVQDELWSHWTFKLALVFLCSSFFALTIYFTQYFLSQGEEEGKERRSGGKGRRRWEKQLVVSMCSCVPALIHGCTVWTLATRELCAQGATVDSANTPIATFTLLFSMSYFLVDSVVLCAFPRANSMLLAHHVASMIDEFMALYFNHGATILLLVMLTGELSNPLHNSAYIAGNYAAHTHTRTAHRLHTRLMVMFASVFAVARFVGCPAVAIYLFWNFFTNANPNPALPLWANFVMSLIPTIGMICSWPFALETIREAKKLVQLQKRREEEGKGMASVSKLGGKQE